MARVFERALETIILALMVALALLVVVAVGFRKAGEALVWYDEVAAILLAWLTYYGAAYAAYRRVHIGFPTLVQGLAPTPQRAVIALRTVIVVGFFGVTAWTGWRVLTVLTGTYLVSLPWLPTQVTQSVIPIGAVLFIAAELLSLPAVWRATRRRGDTP